MKHLLLTTIAAVLVVGCGESQPPEAPTAKAPDISIHDAAMDGNIEAIKQHLAAGADVNTKNDGGETPLDYAGGETSDLLRKHGGKHETIHSADVRDEDGSTHRNFVYWFLWFIVGVINLAILIYLFVA